MSDLPSSECLKHHDLPVFDVAGVPITATSLAQTEKLLMQWANDELGRFVGVRELPSIYALTQTHALRELNYQAAMNVPDGMPLVWLGKRLGLEIERTSGPDLLPYIAQRGEGNQLSHYFYGGQAGVAEALIGKLKVLNPNLKVVGHECPPFRALSEQETDDIRARINAAKPDVVWVGISSPKQDVWMQQNHQHLSATLIGVGAAFDYVSGTKPRAPKWMQRLSLESVYRFVQEPGRLWRRYVIYAPRVVWRALLGGELKMVRK